MCASLHVKILMSRCNDWNHPSLASQSLDSAEEGWIQTTFAEATSFQADLGLACATELEMLPAPLEVQEGSLLCRDIVVSTRSRMINSARLTPAV